MSTPTQPKKKGKEKKQTDRNSRENNGEGSSASRSTPATISPVEAARTAWKSRNAGSQSNPSTFESPSEGTQATTTPQPTQNTATAPDEDENATGQPAADVPGSFNPQARDPAREELEALLSRFQLIFFATWTSPDGTTRAQTLSFDPPTIRPVSIELGQVGGHDLQLDLTLRERDSTEPGLDEASGSPQASDSSEAFNVLELVQAPEVAEVIVARPSRSYQISFGQEQRRQQAEPDVEPETATASSSQPPLAETHPTCIICYEFFTTRSTLLPCGHEFDLDCILPWFQAIHNESPRDSLLTCPLCRQRARSIQNTYTDVGDYQVLDITNHFRRGRANTRPWPVPHPAAIPRPRPNDHGIFPVPHGPNPANPRREQLRGRFQPKTLIFRGLNSDYLDFDVLERMNREYLEVFIADLLAMGRVQLERISGNDLWRLAQIRGAFIEAASKDLPHIARQRQNQRRTFHEFPVGFPHLDWDSLATMNRDELDEFMEIFNSLSDEQVARVPFEDLARLYHRSYFLDNGLEGSYSNAGRKEERRTTHKWGVTR